MTLQRPGGACVGAEHLIPEEAVGVMEVASPALTLALHQCQGPQLLVLSFLNTAFAFLNNLFCE